MSCVRGLFSRKGQRQSTSSETILASDTSALPGTSVAATAEAAAAVTQHVDAEETISNCSDRSRSNSQTLKEQPQTTKNSILSSKQLGSAFAASSVGADTSPWESSTSSRVSRARSLVSRGSKTSSSSLLSRGARAASAAYRSLRGGSAAEKQDKGSSSSSGAAATSSTENGHSSQANKRNTDNTAPLKLPPVVVKGQVKRDWRAARSSGKENSQLPKSITLKTNTPITLPLTTTTVNIAVRGGAPVREELVLPAEVSTSRGVKAKHRHRKEKEETLVVRNDEETLKSKQRYKEWESLVADNDEESVKSKHRSRKEREAVIIGKDEVALKWERMKEWETLVAENDEESLKSKHRSRKEAETVGKDEVALKSKHKSRKEAESSLNDEDSLKAKQKEVETLLGEITYNSKQRTPEELEKLIDEESLKWKQRSRKGSETLTTGKDEGTFVFASVCQDEAIAVDAAQTSSKKISENDADERVAVSSARGSSKSKEIKDAEEAADVSSKRASSKHKRKRVDDAERTVDIARKRVSLKRKELHVDDAEDAVDVSSRRASSKHKRKSVDDSEETVNTSRKRAPLKRKEISSDDADETVETSSKRASSKRKENSEDDAKETVETSRKHPSSKRKENSENDVTETVETSPKRASSKSPPRLVCTWDNVRSSRPSASTVSLPRSTPSLHRLDAARSSSSCSGSALKTSSVGASSSLNKVVARSSVSWNKEVNKGSRTRASEAGSAEVLHRPGSRSGSLNKLRSSKDSVNSAGSAEALHRPGSPLTRSRSGSLNKLRSSKGSVNSEDGGAKDCSSRIGDSAHSLSAKIAEAEAKVEEKEGSSVFERSQALEGSPEGSWSEKHHVLFSETVAVSGGEEDPLDLRPSSEDESIFKKFLPGSTDSVNSRQQEEETTTIACIANEIVSYACFASDPTVTATPRFKNFLTGFHATTGNKVRPTSVDATRTKTGSDAPAVEATTTRKPASNVEAPSEDSTFAQDEERTDLSSVDEARENNDDPTEWEEILVWDGVSADDIQPSLKKKKVSQSQSSEEELEAQPFVRKRRVSHSEKKSHFKSLVQSQSSNEELEVQRFINQRLSQSELTSSHPVEKPASKVPSTSDDESTAQLDDPDPVPIKVQNEERVPFVDQRMSPFEVYALNRPEVERTDSKVPSTSEEESDATFSRADPAPAKGGSKENVTAADSSTASGVSSVIISSSQPFIGAAQSKSDIKVSSASSSAGANTSSKSSSSSGADVEDGIHRRGGQDGNADARTGPADTRSRNEGSRTDSIPAGSQQNFPLASVELTRINTDELQSQNQPVRSNYTAQTSSVQYQQVISLRSDSTGQSNAGQVNQDTSLRSDSNLAASQQFSPLTSLVVTQANKPQTPAARSNFAAQTNSVPFEQDVSLRSDSTTADSQHPIPLTTGVVTHANTPKPGSQNRAHRSTAQTNSVQFGQDISLRSDSTGQSKAGQVKQDTSTKNLQNRHANPDADSKTNLRDLANVVQTQLDTFQKALADANRSQDRDSKTSPDTHSKISPDRDSKTSPDTRSKISPDRDSKTSPDRDSKTSPDRDSKTSLDTHSKTSQENGVHIDPDSGFINASTSETRTPPPFEKSCLVQPLLRCLDDSHPEEKATVDDACARYVLPSASDQACLLQEPEAEKKAGLGLGWGVPIAVTTGHVFFVSPNNDSFLETFAVSANSSRVPSVMSGIAICAKSSTELSVSSSMEAKGVLVAMSEEDSEASCSTKNLDTSVSSQGRSSFTYTLEYAYVIREEDEEVDKDECSQFELCGNVLQHQHHERSCSEYEVSSEIEAAETSHSDQKGSESLLHTETDVSSEQELKENQSLVDREANTSSEQKLNGKQSRLEQEMNRYSEQKLKGHESQPDLETNRSLEKVAITSDHRTDDSKHLSLQEPKETTTSYEQEEAGQTNRHSEQEEAGQTNRHSEKVNFSSDHRTDDSKSSSNDAPGHEAREANRHSDFSSDHKTETDDGKSSSYDEPSSPGHEAKETNRHSEKVQFSSGHRTDDSYDEPGQEARETNEHSQFSSDHKTETDDTKSTSYQKPKETSSSGEKESRESKHHSDHKAKKKSSSKKRLPKSNGSLNLALLADADTPSPSRYDATFQRDIRSEEHERTLQEDHKRVLVTLPEEDKTLPETLPGTLQETLLETLPGTLQGTLLETLPGTPLETLPGIPPQEHKRVPRILPEEHRILEEHKTLPDTPRTLPTLSEEHKTLPDTPRTLPTLSEEHKTLPRTLSTEHKTVVETIPEESSSLQISEHETVEEHSAVSGEDNGDLQSCLQPQHSLPTSCADALSKQRRPFSTPTLVSVDRGCALDSSGNRNDSPPLQVVSENGTHSIQNNIAQSNIAQSNNEAAALVSAAGQSHAASEAGPGLVQSVESSQAASVQSNAHSCSGGVSTQTSSFPSISPQCVSEGVSSQAVCQLQSISQSCSEGVGTQTSNFQSNSQSCSEEISTQTLSISQTCSEEISTQTSQSHSNALESGSQGFNQQSTGVNQQGTQSSDSHEAFAESDVVSAPQPTSHAGSERVNLQTSYYQSVLQSAAGSEGFNQHIDGSEGINQHIDDSEGINQHIDNSEGINQQATANMEAFAESDIVSSPQHRSEGVPLNRDNFAASDETEVVSTHQHRSQGGPLNRDNEAIAESDVVSTHQHRSQGGPLNRDSHEAIAESDVVVTHQPHQHRSQGGTLNRHSHEVLAGSDFVSTLRCQGVPPNRGNYEVFGESSTPQGVPPPPPHPEYIVAESPDELANQTEIADDPDLTPTDDSDPLASETVTLRQGDSTEWIVQETSVQQDEPEVSDTIEEETSCRKNVVNESSDSAGQETGIVLQDEPEVSDNVEEDASCRKNVVNESSDSALTGQETSVQQAEAEVLDNVEEDASCPKNVVNESSDSALTGQETCIVPQDEVEVSNEEVEARRVVNESSAEETCSVVQGEAEPSNTAEENASRRRVVVIENPVTPDVSHLNPMNNPLPRLANVGEAPACRRRVKEQTGMPEFSHLNAMNYGHALGALHEHTNIIIRGGVRQLSGESELNQKQEEECASMGETSEACSERKSPSSNPQSPSFNPQSPSSFPESISSNPQSSSYPQSPSSYPDALDAKDNRVRAKKAALETTGFVIHNRWQAPPNDPAFKNLICVQAAASSQEEKEEGEGGQEEEEDDDEGEEDSDELVSGLMDVFKLDKKCSENKCELNSAYRKLSKKQKKTAVLQHYVAQQVREQAELSRLMKLCDMQGAALKEEKKNLNMELQRSCDLMTGEDEGNAKKHEPLMYKKYLAIKTSMEAKTLVTTIRNRQRALHHLEAMTYRKYVALQHSLKVEVEKAEAEEKKKSSKSCNNSKQLNNGGPAHGGIPPPPKRPRKVKDLNSVSSINPPGSGTTTPLLPLNPNLMPSPSDGSASAGTVALPGLFQGHGAGQGQGGAGGVSVYSWPSSGHLNFEDLLETEV